MKKVVTCFVLRCGGQDLSWFSGVVIVRTTVLSKQVVYACNQHACSLCPGSSLKGSGPLMICQFSILNAVSIFRVVEVQFCSASYVIHLNVCLVAKQTRLTSDRCKIFIEIKYALRELTIRKKHKDWLILDTQQPIWHLQYVFIC